MKKVLKIAYRLAAIVLVVILLLIGVAKLFEKRIIDQAVQEMNEQLAVPVFVDEISFSLLKSFPQASVHLHKFTVLASVDANRNSTAKDTLLHVDELSLSLNSRALINQELKIQQININDGFVNYLVYADGSDNFKLFKEKKEKSTEKAHHDLSVDLERLRLKNIAFKFNNYYKGIFTEVYTTGFNVSAFAKDKVYGLTTKGPLEFRKLQLANVDIDAGTKINVLSELRFSNDTLYVEQGGFALQKSVLETRGFVVVNDRPQVNLNVLGKNLKVETILRQLNTKSSFLSNNKMGGRLNISAAIKGELSQKKSPSIVADIAYSSGHLALTKQKLSLQKLQLNGQFSNGSSRTLASSSFKSSFFHVQVDSSMINGRFEIDNFIKPKIKLDADYNLKISELNELLNSDSFSMSKGDVEGSIKAVGPLNMKEKAPVKYISDLDYRLIANTNDLSFSLSNGFNVNSLSSQLELNPSNLIIANLSGNTLNTEIGFQGFTNNPILMSEAANPKFNLEGELVCGYLKYDVLTPLLKSSDKENTKPLDVNINVQVLCNTFIYDKLVAEQVSGQVSYKNKKLNIQDLNFYAFDGRINSQVMYSPTTTGNYDFFTKVKTNTVDVNKLFVVFDNFGQKNITNEHLFGALNADFECEFLINKGKVDTRSLDLLGHFSVIDGRLINFEPLLSLSSFSEIDELKRVEFSKLENDLLIAREVIHIPQMQIKSNAFDLSVFGKQEFNGDYEYHAKIFLSDFIGGKAKRLRKQQTEFGLIEDEDENKSSLNLLATHENGKSKVRLDKSAFRKQLKEEYKEQKTEIKRLFGSNKQINAKDTSKFEKQTNEEFLIEWDDE